MKKNIFLSVLLFITAIVLYLILFPAPRRLESTPQYKAAFKAAIQKDKTNP